MTLQKTENIVVDQELKEKPGRHFLHVYTHYLYKYMSAEKSKPLANFFYVQEYPFFIVTKCFVLKLNRCNGNSVKKRK